ncbi:ATP synthase F1 subunit epsilon [Lacrimispora sp. 210928-DFI.3.58]|uniref:ATP synthase F1 subunit epsilon n=1 Tax=Lacrimispora sp. 210928-DFI.3.58 TaxID=2883214 RepID=UPI0015B54C80|nr:ATP synthase F1 subunit epsilon [Lacrimispora sp. 210928-DFI.3.58]MCB7320215.1 ATP synthase F1 subunit epsilon [Lacrimispora sp. 210928-DFI.3.58]
MATFHLQIVSMDGLEYDGQVQSVSCRTVHGDLAILARHCNYCTAVGMGTAQVVLEDGSVRKAACIGGMLSVMDGECRLIPTTWEWSEDIDLERAQAAKKKAEERLAQSGISERELKLAEAKLHRALVRIGTAGKQE